MTEPSAFDLLSDDFWENDQHSAALHTRTVLQRIRDDLSRGRPAPISVDEIWEIAQREMGYYPAQCGFSPEEVARPLLVIGAVWAYKAHNLSIERAQAMGGLLGSYAGGDAALGGPSTAAERKLTTVMQERLRRRASLNWRETSELLDSLLQALR